MKNTFRCGCPITSALDIVGDKWTLVIIKQMLFEGRNTFKALHESDEGIATNILSSRLKMLEGYDIIGKRKLPNNQKTNIYFITQKGLELTPLIIELTLWSSNYVGEYHPGLNIDQNHIHILNTKKSAAIDQIITTYKNNNWDTTTDV